MCSSDLKICSKENKPDGFTAVPGTRLHGFLAKIPLERVCGFGPNTVALLEKHGLNTVLDYVERPLSFADALLGKTGRELWQELRGIPVYMVSTEKKDRYLTISKTKTFLPHSGSRDIVKAQLVRNLESALIKLRRHGLAARSVTAFLKRIDYSGSAAEGKINRHSSSTMDFTRLCSDLFDNIFEPGSVYRATGIVLSDIAAERSCEKDLFDDPEGQAGATYKRGDRRHKRRLRQTHRTSGVLGRRRQEERASAQFAYLAQARPA